METWAAVVAAWRGRRPWQEAMLREARRDRSSSTHLGEGGWGCGGGYQGGEGSGGGLEGRRLTGEARLGNASRERSLLTKLRGKAGWRVETMPDLLL
jgi:hypothetical protein